MDGHSEIWYLLLCEKHDYVYFYVLALQIHDFYSINTTEVKKMYYYYYYYVSNYRIPIVCKSHCQINPAASIL